MRRMRWLLLGLLALGLWGCASAETNPAEDDPVLLPHRYQEAPSVVQDKIVAWIQSEEDWKLEDEERSRGSIWAVHYTELFRFSDQVKIKISSSTEGTTVSASSESDFGIFDGGQNRENIQMLWEALDKRLTRIWPMPDSSVAGSE